MPVKFFAEGITFKLKNQRKISAWVKASAQSESYSISNINYIFCSDEYLHSINLKYLSHDTYTDIITFDLDPGSKSIVADIFISVPRVKENAKNFGKPFEEELHRVMIHGILHLVGYSDKESAQKAQMRKKEEAYLSLL